MLCLGATAVSVAQEFDFPAAAVEHEQALAEVMPRLAEQAITRYHEEARDPYLNTLFRLQIVAGRYGEVPATLRSLRDLRRAGDPAHTDSTFVQYEIYAVAKARQASGKLAFDEAYRQAFREVFGRLDDKIVPQVLFSFGADRKAMEDDLRKALERQKGKSRIALTDALDLIRKYQARDAYQAFAPLTEALVAEDDARRYILQDDILIKTRDGASIAAMVVRPRSSPGPLPALFFFTIYVNPAWSRNEARHTAAHGYAAVIAYTRGKGRSPDAIVPYERDGDDAYDVIDWISKQPWNDGRVGMFGGSYVGFTQWAAAKHRHPALKAIMPSAPVAPGIDVPMEGNVFMSFVYPWIPYVTDNKALDDATYDDKARWAALNKNWYTDGKPYRDLDRIDGKPNPIFRRWLDHPSYDAYWQSMIPYREDFAKLDIPVLITTGYYDGCLVSALYYYTEHARYNPRVNHYLVVGPFDHFGSQTRPAAVLQGYEIDPVANIDIRELRYQWFDYVFKGGEKPALLKDRVNYEVMGGNEWRHAPSPDAMSNGSLRFHLSPVRAGDAYGLSAAKPAGDPFLEQKVDLADRTDVNRVSTQLVDRTLDTSNGLAFVSEPVQQPTEISGLFSGQLDFTPNKKDLDINVALYERMPSGEYFQLSYYMARVSYAKDRSHRQLLEPGKRQQLAFSAGRLTSRKLQAGSRIVVVLSIIKQPDEQINYGSGKDVSDESLADAKEPLLVKWYGDSYIDIPVWR